MMGRYFFVAGLLLAACSSGNDEASPEGKAPPVVVLDDPPCAAPGLALPDGACITPGVLPEDCAAGFVTDGEGGCTATIPPMPCDYGMMAVPGDTTCRAIAPCGQTRWADIPTKANTQYVDKNDPATNVDGSASRPWKTVQAAVNSATDGAVIAIAPGTYQENVDIKGKSLRLWGRCADDVTIMGGSGGYAAVQVLGAQASNTVLSRLAITGQGAGLLVAGSVEIQIDKVWIHDVTTRAVNIQDTDGPTSLSVTNSLIDGADELGVFSSGSDLTIRDSVLRNISSGLNDSGSGVLAQKSNETGARSSLLLEGVVIERAEGVGVNLVASDGTISGSVFRLIGGGTGAQGQGIAIYDELATGSDNKGANLLVQGSVIERCDEVGIILSGSTATVENTTIVDTQPDMLGRYGQAIQVEANPFADRQSHLTMRRSLIARARRFGVHVSGSEATIERSIIRDIDLASGGLFGRAINVAEEPSTDATARLILRDSLLEHTHDAAISIRGSSLDMSGTVVQDTLPDDVGLFGRGLHMQPDDASSQMPSATVHNSIFARTREFGIVALGGEMAITSTWVLETAANGSGKYGDGITASRELGFTTLTLSGNQVTNNARAGVANFGSTIALDNTALGCNAFDLEGEAFLGTAFIFENRGRNACGCPAPEATCAAVSVSIEPPSGL